MRLHSIIKVYQLSSALSRELRKINLDLVQAIDLAKALHNELLRICSENTKFSEIPKASIAEFLEIKVKHKRMVSRQKHRGNLQVGSAKDYYRLTVSNPFLDLYITDPEERFTNQENILMALFNHKSSEVDKVAEGFIKTVQFSEQFLVAEPSEVLAELRIWRRYLTTKGSIS